MASKKIKILPNQLVISSLSDDLFLMSLISGACNSGFKSILIGVNESGKVLGINSVGFVEFFTEKINTTFRGLIDFSIDIQNHDYKQYAVFFIENIRMKPIGFYDEGVFYEKMIVSRRVLPLNHLLKAFLIAEQKESLPILSDDILLQLKNITPGKYSYSRFRKTLNLLSISELDDLIVFMLLKRGCNIDFEDNQTFILISE